MAGEKNSTTGRVPIINEKYLIVNADDFGIDRKINQGIAESFNAGIVSSVSLVANGAAFEDAVRLAVLNKNTGAGVHLCLIGEQALLGKKEIPDLIGTDNYLPRDFFQLLRGLYIRRIPLAQIGRELEAQIQKVIAHGIIPTHLDSHQYTHLLPGIFEITLNLAKKYNIAWVQYPRPTMIQPLATRSAYLKKAYLCLFSPHQLKSLRRSQFSFADSSCGVMCNGHLTEAAIRGFLLNLAAGRHEITCHPGYFPENAKYLRWGYTWEEELKILKNDALKPFLESLNIRPVNYGK